jgi:uncharacterized protein YciI
MFHRLTITACLAASVHVLAPSAAAQPGAGAASPAYDPELAQRLGADERGMRRYVLVVLKTGPKRMPDGPAREAMFKGHFANMKRLSDEGKLALAGPFDGAEGWRGLFVFAVPDVEEARRLVASDPVVTEGEMVAEFHPWYGSAALMLVPGTHDQLAKKP